MRQTTLLPSSLWLVTTLAAEIEVAGAERRISGGECSPEKNLSENSMRYAEEHGDKVMTDILR